MDLISQQRFEQNQVVVIVPTFNNAATLGKLLNDVLQFTNRIIVVNDGSTDGTAEVLAKFSSLVVVGYERNVGKGWVLRCGFKKALELGFQHAITIDSDGQHFAEDLPKFMDEFEKNPGSLIIGKRNMTQAGIPGKSSFGNKFSNFWFWFETGITMEDTQCGYRLYPITRLESIQFFTKKFEFEIEVIVRAAWRGIRVASVPIKIHYDEKGKRVSHFRPFQDFSRISLLNTVLVTVALVYIKPRDFFRRLTSKDSRKKLMNQIFHPGDSHVRKASSIGFGVFMGIVPIWGFQLITAIALSVLLRLNKPLVILAANISIPPLLPFILYGSHLTGKLWLGQKATHISFDKSLSLQDIQSSFAQYVIGAVTLSIAAGLLVGLVTFVMLKLFKRAPAQA
jgi:glycosyltransferase involved in cell wall biosynthesis